VLPWPSLLPPNLISIAWMHAPPSSERDRPCKSSQVRHCSLPLPLPHRHLDPELEPEPRSACDSRGLVKLRLGHRRSCLLACLPCLALPCCLPGLACSLLPSTHHLSAISASRSCLEHSSHIPSWVNPILSLRTGQDLSLEMRTAPAVVFRPT
jgi:hypothetical protein